MVMLPKFGKIMSAKLATLGLLKIKLFWSKGYNVIISFHDVCGQKSWRDNLYFKIPLF